MSIFKKTRSDSTLGALSEDLRAELAEWLLNGLSYEKAKEKLKREHGIHTTTSALCGFWGSYVSPLLLERRRTAVTSANHLAEEIQKEPGQWDQPSLDTLKQLTFQLLQNPGSDPADIMKLMILVQKSRDQDLKAQDLELRKRRIELLERQHEQALGVVSDEALSAEEKTKRIKHILGISAQ